MNFLIMDKILFFLIDNFITSYPTIYLLGIVSNDYQAFYDLDLFTSNTHNSNINPDCNVLHKIIDGKHYSPYKSAEFIKKLESEICLSILHNNVRGLSKSFFLLGVLQCI